MTTNIGLVTSDAVVLGCDSIASASNWFLDPFKLAWAKDGDGKPIPDADGKYSLKFEFSDLESIVTNSWGGVTKMFLIHPGPSALVAITTGIARLNGRPIASLAGEFLAQMKAREKKKFVKCEVICRRFLEFMRAAYDEHYSENPVPDSLKDSLDLLVGGVGRDDKFPSMFRLRVGENQMFEEYGPNAKDGRSGLIWGGQADAIQRFVRGYDPDVRHRIEGIIDDYLGKNASATNDYVVKLLNTVLKKTGQPMPDGIKIKVPTINKVDIDWRNNHLDIDFANLPIQEAINLVSFLVNLQSGRSRFSRGVATVGGRTHIGVITKSNGFVALNEPELTHRYTGLGDDQL